MSSRDLDVLPEAKASTDVRDFWAWLLVLPRSALMALTVDDHVVELNAMWALQVVCCLLGLLQPIRAHSVLRKVLVATAGDGVVALRDDVSVDAGFHGTNLFRCDFNVTLTRLQCDLGREAVALLPGRKMPGWAPAFGASRHDA